MIARSYLPAILESIEENVLKSLKTAKSPVDAVLLFCRDVTKSGRIQTASGKKKN